MKSNAQFAMPEAKVVVKTPRTTPAPDPVNGPEKKIDAEEAWRKLVAREASGQFLYAVTTTGVFCRPDCKSRRPLRANVRFFATAEAAQRAGFRPCLRCRPATAWGNPLDMVRGYIETHLDRPIRLAELGRVAGMSPFTVQRGFKQAMGVSPLEYQRGLRAATLREALKKGESVTNAIYEAGYGSASRGYEGAQLGMTPARFAAGGRGEEIGFTTAETRFGWLIIGATQRGLCWLALGSTREEAEESLRTEFPAATLRRDASLACLVERALQAVSGGDADLPLDLRGTAFQLKVWRALRAIPRGETRTYSQLAREMGDPKATRAVARACALNRVSLVVPCHRVVGVSGSLTGYRWGVDRKRQLLEAEKNA